MSGYLTEVDEGRILSGVRIKGIFLKEGQSTHSLSQSNWDLVSGWKVIHFLCQDLSRVRSLQALISNFPWWHTSKIQSILVFYLTVPLCLMLGLQWNVLALHFQWHGKCFTAYECSGGHSWRMQICLKLLCQEDVFSPAVNSAAIVLSWAWRWILSHKLIFCFHAKWFWWSQEIKYGVKFRVHWKIRAISSFWFRYHHTFQILKGHICTWLIQLCF